MQPAAAPSVLLSNYHLLTTRHCHLHRPLFGAGELLRTNAKKPNSAPYPWTWSLRRAGGERRRRIGLLHLVYRPFFFWVPCTCKISRFVRSGTSSALRDWTATTTSCDRETRTGRKTPTNAHRKIACDLGVSVKAGLHCGPWTGLWTGLDCDRTRLYIAWADQRSALCY